MVLGKVTGAHGVAARKRRPLRPTVALALVLWACSFQSYEDLQSGRCPSGQKSCVVSGTPTCVSLTDPDFGCASKSCEACYVDHGFMKCGDDGACAFSACAGAYRDCDSDLSNGCEADTDFDIRHCGASCKACELAHASLELCSAGRCTPVDCEAGFGDCNAITDDGCETDLTASKEHCGACGRSCGASQQCVQSACR